MPIGVGEEHEALRQTARRWVEARCPASVPRALLDAPSETLPEFWGELAEQGWLGMHLPEEHGGQGFGLAELAVVLEELGRAVAPGPFLPTVLAASIVAEGGTRVQHAELLPGFADGSTPAAVAFCSGVLTAVRGDEGLEVNGRLRPVLGAALAERIVVPVQVGDPTTRPKDEAAAGTCWCVLDAGALQVDPLSSLDATRRVASVSARDVLVVPERQLVGISDARVSELVGTIVAAECAGGLAWCLETASSYAKVREQFGRPIGQFQAVKHRLADMLVSAEQVVATAWDAAQTNGAALPAAAAAALALDGYVEAAKGCIQVLGGIGYTWEHDAHMHLKRAVSLRQLLGGSEVWRQKVTVLAISGARRSLAEDLLGAMSQEEAASIREAVVPELEELKALHGRQRRERMVELGHMVPHWPPPWGRGAGPVEQLVIAAEMERAHLRAPSLAIGAWALPTIIGHGTPSQKERWVLPTLLGDITWCQMFSEPGAGSDLASLSTKAVKDKGGWRLSGQKVWTSIAQRADFAICLARTDPNAPKHQGITYFILEMRSEGLDIRPLRELTGETMFNEVFLSDVFVADDSVIGEVNDGWRLARTTLANERVSMSTGASFGRGVEALLELISEEGSDDPITSERVGALLAEAESLALLGHRATLRAISGMDPGPESSVRKLLGVEHDQRVQELGLSLMGPAGATNEAEVARWTYGFLGSRCLTIAGGTSEVQRNLIAERILGLPRD